jgi:hypothetical protein
MMMKFKTHIMSHFPRPRQEKWDILTLAAGRVESAPDTAVVKSLNFLS